MAARRYRGFYTSYRCIHLADRGLGDLYGRIRRPSFEMRIDVQRQIAHPPADD